MIWLLLAAAAVFCLSAWRLHHRRLKQWDDLSETGIASSLHLLFECGYDGATMILRDMGSERFVQFRKYIAEPGKMGLETHFPSAPWSREYYDSVLALLRKKAIAFEILTTNARPTTEFVHIDFGSDVTQAAAWTVEVFRLVFGCSELRVSVRAEDIEPTGKRVERVDHPRPIDYLLRR